MKRERSFYLTVFVFLLLPTIASASMVTTSWEARVWARSQYLGTDIAIDDILRWTTTYDDASVLYTYYSDGVDGIARTSDDTSSDYGLSSYTTVSDAIVTYDSKILNFLYNDEASTRIDAYSYNFVKVSGLDGNLYFQDFFDSASTNVFYTDWGNSDPDDDGMYGSIAYDAKRGASQTYVAIHFKVTSIATTQANPAVPVPGAIWLLGSGLIGLVGLGRRKLK